MEAEPLHTSPNNNAKWECMYTTVGDHSRHVMSWRHHWAQTRLGRSPSSCVPFRRVLYQDYRSCHYGDGVRWSVVLHVISFSVQAQSYFLKRSRTVDTRKSFHAKNIALLVMHRGSHKAAQTMQTIHIPHDSFYCGEVSMKV